VTILLTDLPLLEVRSDVTNVNTIRYDTIEAIKGGSVDSKAGCGQLNLMHVARSKIV